MDWRTLSRYLDFVVFASLYWFTGFDFNTIPIQSIDDVCLWWCCRHPFLFEGNSFAKFNYVQSKSLLNKECNFQWSDDSSCSCAGFYFPFSPLSDGMTFSSLPSFVWCCLISPFFWNVRSSHFSFSPFVISISFFLLLGRAPWLRPSFGDAVFRHLLDDAGRCCCRICFLLILVLSRGAVFFCLPEKWVTSTFSNKVCIKEDWRNTFDNLREKKKRSKGISPRRAEKLL